MNKSELIMIVSETCGISKKDTERITDALLEEIEKALVNGEVVKLSGFGAFQVKGRKSRIGTSPVGEHEKITIPATKTVGFKASKNLKEAVR